MANTLPNVLAVVGLTVFVYGVGFAHGWMGGRSRERMDELVRRIEEDTP